MKQSIAWHIGTDGKPARLQPGAVDLEEHLEDWLTDEIDIVASDILVIDRQAKTGWGTKLDLLAIDAEGRLVIVELKRAQTLRDTVAQAIEYAAWCSRLSYVEIRERAAEYFGSDDALEERFLERFATELPDTLNASQRILVVAPTIDDVTEAVVNYLAEAFKMPINAVGFDVFGVPGNQTLVRHFVREPSSVPTPPTSKKRSARSLDQIVELASENGVGEIVDEFLKLRDLLPQIVPYYFTFNMRSKTSEGRSISGLSVYPTAETEAGAVVLYVGYQNLGDIFDRNAEDGALLQSKLRSNAHRIENNWQGWDKFRVKSAGEASQMCAHIRAYVSGTAPDPAASVMPA